MKTTAASPKLTPEELFLLEKDHRADDTILFNEKNSPALFMHALLVLREANRKISVLDAQLKMERAKMERLKNGRTR